MRTRLLCAVAALPLFGGCVPGANRDQENFPPSIRPSGPPPVFEAPISAATPPPAVTGGTLLPLADGRTAVAADADRDQVFVVDYASPKLLASVSLQPGDEPGRAVQDGAGRVHVALRRGGAVVTLLPGTWEIAARRPVCAAPRGIAYDAGADLLHVACAEGELVSLQPAPDGAVTRRLALDGDLRDVVVKGNRVFVSRFRSSEVLVVEGEQMVARVAPPMSQSLNKQMLQNGATLAPVSMVPSVAWRMVADPNGDVMVLHQRAAAGPVSVDQGGYGGAFCGGIVETTVSPVRPSVAGAATPSPAIGNLTLAVDVAIAPDGRTIAVAGPGNARQSASGGQFTQVGIVDANGLVTSGACVFPSNVVGSPGSPPERVRVPPDAGAAPDGGTGESDGGAPSTDAEIPQTSTGTGTEAPRPSVLAAPLGEVVAVAFDAAGNLLAQMREPALVQVLTGDKFVKLSNDSRLDTGHAIFHANSGAGVACASCHPEGGDDGRVWKFQNKDGSATPRRTQNLRGGVLGTAPFHWDGTLPTVDSLMTEVFVGRMSGPELSPEHIGTLSHWLDRIPAMPARPVADADAVARGHALFEGSGCARCHLGALLTDNRTQDVGTGMALQTPSLRGAGWRAPYMHDGCAATLADRFAAGCGGGDKHGVTSGLSPTQIADLSAYIETL